MYQGIIFGSAAALTAIILLIYKNKSEESFLKFFKIFTFAFCAVGFFRFLLSDSFILVIKGGYFDGVYYDKTDVLQTVLRWGYYLTYTIYPMAVFFKNRLFRNIACYFCLPFSILSTVFFNDFMVYYLSPTGRGFFLTPPVRYAVFATELSMAIIVPLLIFFKFKHSFDVKSKKEWLNFLITLPFVILQFMPIYAPQSLIGYSTLKADMFTPMHFAWLTVTVIEIVVLYYVFRFKPYEDRYALVVFFTIALFFHHQTQYSMGLTLSRLPIQLCNMAAYFYMIAVLFKKRALFNFCYVVNIVGTAFAMLAPDLSVGALGFWNMHFLIEHMLVFIVPILCMNLRIFPRIEKDALKHSIIGFTIYFLFCLISGTIINGYEDVTGISVNYFYLFDFDKAFDYFPFLSFTQRVRIGLGRFEIYPVYLIIFFCGYFAICIAWYFAARYIYKINDDHFALRGARIDLYEEITGKKSKCKRQYDD